MVRARYRGAVRVGFPALHSIRGLEDGQDVGRPHGHDFTAEFVFETHLVHLGVVVDADTREEIERHVRDRLAYRDWTGSWPARRPAKPSPITWPVGSCSARPPGDARLVSVLVSTGSGGHGQIVLTEER